MATEPGASPTETPLIERGAGEGGGVWSWPEIRRGTPLRIFIDLVQYGVAVVLLVLAAVVLVRSFITFVTSLNAAAPNYTQSLISAIDGVLVVIILVDIMRTVLTHLEGWGFPFRPFLVIGIIAAVRDILAVSNSAHPVLRINHRSDTHYAVIAGTRNQCCGHSRPGRGALLDAWAGRRRRD